MKHESGLTLNQLAERNANLVTEIEKCRELSGCPAGVDLQDWVKQLAAESLSIKAMNDCLSEELRGYESDGAFDGPKMHLLWWQVETPATDAFLDEVRAQSFSELIDAFSKDIVHTGLDDSSTVTIFECKEALKHVAEQLREGADK